MVDRSQQANAAENRRTQELAGLYEISRILSEIGDFVPKATAAMEKVAALADADWVTLRMPNDQEPGLHLIAAAGPEVAEKPPIQVFTGAMTVSTKVFGEGSKQPVHTDNSSNLCRLAKTEWASPFHVGPDGAAAECLVKYAELWYKPEQDKLRG